MIRIFILALLFLSSSASGQKVPESCNQLPYAKVDTKAMLTNQLDKIIKKDLPAELKAKGNHDAVFKLFVDCKGMIENPHYEKGDLNEGQQQWLTTMVAKSTWVAAVLEDIYVTSVVFLSVTIKNGQVDVIIQ